MNFYGAKRHHIPEYINLRVNILSNFIHGYTNIVVTIGSKFQNSKDSSFGTSSMF
jgi:hypothetical protein